MSFLAFGDLWRYRYPAEAVTHFKSWERVSSWRLTGKVLHCQVTRQLKSLLTLGYIFYRISVINHWANRRHCPFLYQTWFINRICCHFLHSAILEPHGVMDRQNSYVSDLELKGQDYFTLTLECCLKIKWLWWGFFTAWEFKHVSVLMACERSLSFARWVAGTTPWCLLTLLLYNSFIYSRPLCFMQPDQQAKLDAVSAVRVVARVHTVLWDGD